MILLILCTPIMRLISFGYKNIVLKNKRLLGRWLSTSVEPLLSYKTIADILLLPEHFVNSDVMDLSRNVQS